MNKKFPKKVFIQEGNFEKNIAEKKARDDIACSFVDRSRQTACLIMLLTEKRNVMIIFLWIITVDKNVRYSKGNKTFEALL